MLVFHGEIRARNPSNESCFLRSMSLEPRSRELQAMVFETMFVSFSPWDLSIPSSSKPHEPTHSAQMDCTTLQKTSKSLSSVSPKALNHYTILFTWWLRTSRTAHMVAQICSDSFESLGTLHTHHHPSLIHSPSSSRPSQAQMLPGTLPNFSAACASAVTRFRSPRRQLRAREPIRRSTGMV